MAVAHITTIDELIEQIERETEERIRDIHHITEEFRAMAAEAQRISAECARITRELVAVRLQVDEAVGPADEGHSRNCNCWDCRAGNFDPTMDVPTPSRG